MKTLPLQVILRGQDWLNMQQQLSSFSDASASHAQVLRILHGPRSLLLHVCRDIWLHCRSFCTKKIVHCFPILYHLLTYPTTWYNCFLPAEAPENTTVYPKFQGCCRVFFLLSPEAVCMSSKDGTEYKPGQMLPLLKDWGPRGLLAEDQYAPAECSWSRSFLDK